MSDETSSSAPIDMALDPIPQPASAPMPPADPPPASVEPAAETPPESPAPAASDPGAVTEGKPTTLREIPYAGESPPDVLADSSANDPIAAPYTPEQFALDVSDDRLATIQRLRTKLGAYGQECLKSVQAEIEQLIRLS